MSTEHLEPLKPREKWTYPDTSIYDYSATTIDGKNISLRKFSGNFLLILIIDK
jgi:hypothetical protein